MSELNARERLSKLFYSIAVQDCLWIKPHTDDWEDLDALLADFVKCANKSKPRPFQAEYDLLVRAKLLGYFNDA